LGGSDLREEEEAAAGTIGPGRRRAFRCCSGSFQIREWRGGDPREE